MIIARLTDGSIILGLSRENFRRLELGNPISITKESHGIELPAELPQIGIMFGETEAEILAELEAANSAP